MNTILIQLCEEDRERLDKIIEGLDRLSRDTRPIIATGLIAEMPTTEPNAKAEALPESPTTPQDEPEAQTLELVNPTEETNTSEGTEGDDEPTVTLEQIQQKVLQLATHNGGAKKAQVRTIISAYGAKVSDLKEQPDKWTEVWEKLTALESEA